jgi:methyl-accepting chemotaxis protein
LIEKAIGFWMSNKPVDATKVLIKEIRPLQRQWTARLDELSGLKDRLNTVAAQDARKSFDNARVLMIALGIFAVGLGGLTAYAITAGLTQQLGGEPDYAVGIARQIASGDLTTHIRVQPTDTSSTLVALKTMRDSLVEIVGKVREGTDSIANASQEIANGNFDLSQRTERQASSLEKTASAMTQMTLTVQRNADSAHQANLLAASASQVAQKSSDAVSKVVETMQCINEASKRISDIISVIDGIAFQTNILALNAAVEAARAGEQGRGFAVVASEVRSLAGRSANAAKEIKSLINASVEHIGEGTMLVDRAGKVMSEVVSSIRSVSDIMREISSASAEQSTEIVQVNRSIGDIDSVTQQNAALVEEAAAAARGLQEQAVDLADLVSIFKLGDYNGHVSYVAHVKPYATQRVAA